MHIQTEELQKLEEALQESTAPDRALDAWIERLFRPSEDIPPESVRRYTNSIDAVFALGRGVPGLKLPRLYTEAVLGIPPGVAGQAFIPVFSRLFCLEVVRAVRRRELLFIQEKS